MIPEEINFICNNESVSLMLNPSKPLLDAIREDIKLSGTKEGCKEGDCGACTVLIGSMADGYITYRNINSCLSPVKSIKNKHLVTIEGLQNKVLSRLQEMFLEEGATQCGFCTPGFLVSFSAFLLSAKSYTYSNLLNYISGNVCRCTGHIAIERVVNKFIIWLNSSFNQEDDKTDQLIRLNLIPDYFSDIPSRLTDLSETKTAPLSSDDLSTYDYVVAGGTDLFVQKPDELQSANILFIEPKSDIKNINYNEQSIIISGDTILSDIEDSDLIKVHAPQIQESLVYFGSKPIRNRATIAGNIKNASPIADIINILLVLNARLIIESNNKIRTTSLHNFYISYKNVDLAPDEIIKTVEFEPIGNRLFNYEKVSKRQHLDIASVNSSILIQVNDLIIEEVRISAGGVAPIPLRLKKTEKYLKDKELNPETLKKSVACLLSEISPITDARGSKEYKSLLLQRLYFAHFIELFPQLISSRDLL